MSRRYNLFWVIPRNRKSCVSEHITGIHNRVGVSVFIKDSNDGPSWGSLLSYIYDKAKTDKLISNKYQNAKAYWRLLKQTANKNTKNSISSKQFADYFKAVNDPSDRFYQVDEDILFFNGRYVRGEFQIIFDELNREILKTELITAIKQLRNGASSGPDLLLNEFSKTDLKLLFTICMLYLTNCFK